MSRVLKWGVPAQPVGDEPASDLYVNDEVGLRLADLTDGEGCFYIAPIGSGFRCTFTIKMRRDDHELLAFFHDELGSPGRVRPVATSGGRRQPAIEWRIERKAECVWLTRFFDAYPLWSKKSRDYAIWREAVIAWQSVDAGADWSEIGGRRDALMAVREYREEVLA